MIELQKAEKLYGRNRSQQLKNGRGFQDFTLVIPDGQVVGLLGENGAGKSTLLRAMAGLTNLTGGTVRFDGKPVGEIYQEFSYITSEGSYFPGMSPIEYAKFLTGFYPNFNKQRYAKLLEFFELDAKQQIGKMSTGQRAKVEVAAGMSKRAKYILMDEPFLGKDVFTRRDFLKLMAGSLHGEETILLASHHVEEIEPFIDRAVILHKGRLAADTVMDDLMEEGKTLMELLQKATGYDPEKYRRLFDGEE